MKKIVLASLAALTFATPSFAAGFSGPRVGATIGLADDDFLGTEVFTYGLNAGYDVDLGTAVVGGSVTSGLAVVGTVLAGVVELGGPPARSRDAPS